MNNDVRIINSNAKEKKRNDGMHIGEKHAKVKANSEKIRWIKRAEQFAKRYFEGDLRKMTYCLKDVDAWKNWVDLKREYTDVPWDQFFEDSDNN